MRDPPNTATRRIFASAISSRFLTYAAASVAARSLRR
jgi:hypothetical protein